MMFFSSSQVLGSSQILHTMVLTVLSIVVEKSVSEKRKLGQGGERGDTLKVIMEDDHTPHCRRRFTCVVDRLYIRKADGVHPTHFASVLGIGDDTSISAPLVISTTAERMRAFIKLWFSLCCTLVLKG